MADPQFRVAYEAAERAVAGTGEQAAPTARLCTDKNGFHDPHDYYDDPCDVQSIYCPGYPVPKKADAAPAPTPAEGVPTAHQHWVGDRTYRWCHLTHCAEAAGTQDGGASRD
jgi:hypothetical protein